MERQELYFVLQKMFEKGKENPTTSEDDPAF